MSIQDLKASSRTAAAPARRGVELLAIHGGTPVIKQPGPHFRWPPVTEATRRAVLRQLDEAVSIRDRSGVVARLEQRLEREIGLRHAVLFNSGTSAIHAMFVGAGLGPGDEVLCPDYTFFASISPLFFTGATPVLVDCDASGNPDPEQAQRLVTARTRALLVAHIWGVPCAMEPLVELCREHGLLLLEDMSHVWGATYGGRPMGTFGAAAALSLQAQKTLSGGEGGVLFTDDPEIHHRAIALGHYNRRCLQEIPDDHLLHEYGATGMGLKLRIHPLAAAIAEQQLDTVPEVLAGRRRTAAWMRRELAAIAGIELPPIPPRAEPSWFGLLFTLDRRLAGRCTVDEVFAALQAEGCCEIDRPKLTAPLHHYPLFRHPGRVFPGYGSLPERDYPGAEDFYRRIFKLPVWHRAEDEALVAQYLEAIRKVMKHFA
jgi:dTDP-4-amino-4,6-dideoxygalactose transaminase